ncbi:MAG: CDP-alcohol phosphatidyltransferase family protein [Saprospiraceae bacterium]|nr:CDP-alcohol phosphatidyltransferase family protein [Saprospiraceae bacterium]
MISPKSVISVQRLHKNLWWYSVANILLTLVTLYTKDMVWLIAGSVLGLLYWISRYFIDHPNISFPQSPANALTLLRICLLVMTTMMSPGITLFEAGVLYSIICLGDILDGYVARKLNMTTLIGEYLDKETDALFVLMSTTVLYLTGHAGRWVIGLGLIRYIYFTGMYFFITPDQKEIKDPWAKYIAIFLFVSILSCFLLPGTFSKSLLITAAGLILYSFTRVALIELRIIKVAE